MDPRHGPPAAVSHDADDGGLAAARLQIQALTDNGMSPEALLRALLEKCPTQVPAPALWPRPESYLTPAPSSPSSCASPTSTAHSASIPTTFGQTIAAAFDRISSASEPHDNMPTGAKHGARLSVSTTRSGSSGRSVSGRSRASIMSVATSISSTSSQGSIGRYSQLPGTQQFNSRPSTRAYWCTACPQKLQRKFDWKRHEDEFHERYKKYPCPDCNRVFWGANTFNQHHKTRHACTTCPHADKVVRYSKRKRAWGCGFCAAFLPTLERYFDHVAIHYESGKTKAHWDHALVIYGLLHQPVITDAWKALKSSKYGHLPRDQQPKISWDPRNTGRSHGYLENESPGQLQDLLEFFDPAKESAQSIVELAWEQAIHVTQSSYSVPIDTANVRRPSQYLGNTQIVPPEEDTKAPSHVQDQQQPQQPQQQSPAQQQHHILQTQQHPQPPQQQQQLPQQPSPQEQILLIKQEWPVTTGSSPIPTSIAHVMTPAPNPTSQQMEVPDGMVIDRPHPDPMMLERPLPPAAFEQTYYSPVQVDYAGAPPAHPMDYTSFHTFATPMIYSDADWSSITSTMISDSGVPDQAQQQMQMQQQVHEQQQQQPPMQGQPQGMPPQQVHQQQQAFWPNGLYAIQS